MRPLLLLLILFPLRLSAQEMWINEFHYDNTGTDTLEFVEIIVRGAPPASLHMYLYNGLSGLPYDSIALTDMVAGCTEDSFHFFTWWPSTLQNGPDGIVLSQGSKVVQFLCYESSFTATGGIAVGLAGELLPVKENGTASAGGSLSLSGTGSARRHFAWEGSDESSPGCQNANQILTTSSLLFSPDSVLHFTPVSAGDKGKPLVYSITGINLSEEIQVRTPPGFEIAMDSSFLHFYTFPDTLILTPEGKNLSSTIYIRFTPGPEPGRVYDGELIHQTGKQQLTISLYAREGTVKLPEAWINEFHYDNSGTDVNEFVEIVIHDPGDVDLSQLRLLLYNGSGGTVYDQRSLTEFTPGDTVDHAYFFFSTTFSSIQNGGFDPVSSGEPDGLALAYSDRLIQFLSYEGNFLGNDGPATGILSRDIGVSEAPDLPLNSSIQLEGDGYQYGDFLWRVTPGSNTRGHANADQSLPVVLLGPELRMEGSRLMLTWKTTSEVNCEGFSIESSADGNSYHVVGYLKSTGRSGESSTYTFDLLPPWDRFYRLKQIDLNGRTGIFGPVLNHRMEIIPVYLAPHPFTLFSHFNSSEPVAPDELLQVEIHSTDGKAIFQSVSWQARQQVEKLLSELPSGIYLLRIRLGSYDSGLQQVIRQ